MIVSKKVVDMDDDEYEILPRQLMADLKSEVEQLKKRLAQPDNKASELILEIESMKDSIHELNVVFQQALKETKEDDVIVKISDINRKLNDVLNQNEVIAKGMLAISDKVDEFIGRQQGASLSVSMPSSPSAMSIKHDIGAPAMGGSPSRTAPLPTISDNDTPNLDVNFPPPPPSFTQSKKRIGLFR
jgi:septal ring factor EnvC (AmiA/AmiB activator)